MKPTTGHRKLVWHFHDLGHVRELTFSWYHRWPLLTNDAWRAMLSESIDRAIERHRHRLTGFVFMPEHVHLLVYPQADADPIDALLKAIKRPFSYRMKRLLMQSGSPLLERLTVRQRPGKTTFRFWQEGPGYDRNLSQPAAVPAALGYLHLNPVRRRLVKQAVDWKGSSARIYHADAMLLATGLPTVHRLPAEWLLET